MIWLSSVWVPRGSRWALRRRRGPRPRNHRERCPRQPRCSNFPPGMTFFTTPTCSKRRLPFVTPYEKPTRHEGLYYRRVVDAYQLRISFGEEVTRSRRTTAKTATSSSSIRRRIGVRRAFSANVVFAVGYHDRANLLDVPGEDLPHASLLRRSARVLHRERDAHRQRQESAAIAALELLSLGRAGDVGAPQRDAV